MRKLTASQTWVAWFLAIAIPGAIAEVGLQTNGLPMVYGFFFMLFVITVALAVAEVQELMVGLDDIEFTDNAELQADIDKELNGRE